MCNAARVVLSIPCIAGWYVDDDFGAAAVGWSRPSVIASSGWLPTFGDVVRCAGAWLCGDFGTGALRFLALLRA